MRYRPFAHFNLSVSAVSGTLTDDEGARSAETWQGLVDAAMQSGINFFEIQGRHPNIAKGLQLALQAVDRGLVLIGLRVGPRSIPEEYGSRAFHPQLVQASIKSAMVRTGLNYLDLVLLDDPGDQDLPPQTLALLKDLKAKGVIRYIGVAGDSEAIDAYISTNAFDCLALPFSMTSGWRERIRLRAAQEHEMAVMGYHYYPELLHPAAEPVEQKRSLWPRKPAPDAQPSPYAFLGATLHWSAEQIALAYALTEPSLAMVQTPLSDIERLRGLAEVSERLMPAGLAAQIEMARIGPGKGPEARRHA